LWQIRIDIDLDHMLQNIEVHESMKWLTHFADLLCEAMEMHNGSIVNAI